MSLAFLFHFLCAQHVSDINISIIRSLRLCCWINTSAVLFSVRCVLEIWCGWFWIVLVLQAEAQLYCKLSETNGFSETCVGSKFWPVVAKFEIAKTEITIVGPPRSHIIYYLLVWGVVGEPITRHALNMHKDDVMFRHGDNFKPLKTLIKWNHFCQDCNILRDADARIGQYSYLHITTTVW